MVDEVANKNFLSPLNFKFQLKRAPHVNFFIQTIVIPGISLPSVDTPNPFVKLPYAGDHLSYDELSFSFKVDEDLQNYLEIHNWLRYEGKLYFEEYKELAAAPRYTGEGLKSDISVSLLTSNRQANYEVVFKDAFPISLSSITLSTTTPDINYIEASASFRYLYFDISKING
jgi:hypothetical protein